LEVQFSFGTPSLPCTLWVKRRGRQGVKGGGGRQGVWPGHKLNQTKAKSSVKMWSDDGSTSIEFYIDLSLLRCFWSNDTLKK